MADDLGVQRAALAYLHVVILGLPALLVATVAAAGLQAAGDTRTPFVIGLGANTINISLNLILIFGWGLIPALGIRGAAIASLAATLFNAIFLCRELLRPQGRLNLRGWGQELPALGKILRISGPTFVEQVVEHLGYNCFVAMIIALGSTAMATHQVLLSLESVCFLSAEGFGVAGAAIVAQYLGAQQWRHATWGAWITTGLALVLLCIFGLTFLTLPRFLLALFTPDPDIIGVGIACLTIAAFAQPFMALGIVLGDTLRGAGDTRTALVVSLSGWLVVRSIMTYYFAFGLGLGLVGVWLGSTCDWIFRAGVLTMIFLGDRWRKVQF
jgi:putative MATE family efflux protein